MSMTATHAGAKDHPITLQEKSSDRTPAGGDRATWSDLEQVLASRSDQPGGEDYEGDQKRGTVEVTWRIWFRDDIDMSNHRVRDDIDSRIYDIHGIRQIGRRQELELRTHSTENVEV